MSKIIPYRGEEPYIFISYAHRDKAEVYPILERMQADGYRVWFDEGIDPGTEWDEVIAAHVESCGYFLAFISENYLASENCKDELNYARDLNKKRLLVYLEEVKLPGGMAMRMNRLQSVYKSKYENEGDFYTTLYAAEEIDGFRSASASAQSSNTAPAPTPASAAPVVGVEGLRFVPSEKASGFAVSSIGDCTETVLVIPSEYHGRPVTGIEDGAFRACTSLASVTLPASVTYIGESAFYGCERLSSLFLEDGLCEIGDNAFQDCVSLTYVYLPRTVTHVGDWAFAGCDKLSSLTVERGNKTYHSEGNCLIETKSRTLIAGCRGSEIPMDGSVTEIAWTAFSECRGLASVHIPSAVTRIALGAFEGCSGLESITVGGGNRVYHGAGNCLIETNRREVVLGCKRSEIPADGSVTAIGTSAFSHCEELTFLGIPESITRIGSNAFLGCKRLNAVHIPDSVTEIGAWAFWGCESLTSVQISRHVRQIGDAPFLYCKNLASITVEQGNPRYYSAGECLIDQTKKTVLSGCKNSIIPADGSVTRIGSAAFAGCVGLRTFAVPAAVTEIGDSAFYFCTGLTHVSVGAGLVRVEDFAFFGCDQLKELGYSGARAKWHAVKKGNAWRDGVAPEFRVFCMDGETL